MVLQHIKEAVKQSPFFVFSLLMKSPPLIMNHIFSFMNMLSITVDECLFC